jgi:hypothetical protein
MEKRQENKTDKYDEFVDHPRYGRRPKITGLNPNPTDRGVHLHWNTTTHEEIVAQYEAAIGKKWPYGDWSSYSETTRIPNTAIVADLSRQTPATIPVTHYFDLERTCLDCRRSFIFFAAEQKYWYEELGFGLESDCIRCVECRKRQQGIVRQREQYETLFRVEHRTEEQTLQMAEACLSLIESGIFAVRQTERVRMLLNSFREDADARGGPRFTDLVKRLLAAERKAGEPSASPKRR